MPCHYSIPNPPDGESFDPDRVNVSVALDGGNREPIARVSPPDSGTNCASSGWYYDDPLRPQTIALCSETCALVKDGAGVDIELGCLTVSGNP